MVPPHKVVLELDHVVLVFPVSPVHRLQEADLDLGLVQEGLLVLDDLDGDVAALLVVERLNHLAERALAWIRNELKTVYLKLFVGILAQNIRK